MPVAYLAIKRSINEFSKRLNGNGAGAILARGASGAFAITVLGTALSFVTNMLLARVLGVTHYGIYIYALTWINLLALLCKFGMDSSLVRFVAAYNARSEWGLLRGIFVRSIQSVVAASIIVGVITSIAVLTLYDHLGADQVYTFLVALLLLPFLAISAIRTSGLNAFKRVVLAGLPDALVRPMLIVAMVVAVYLLFPSPLAAYEVMAINLIATIVAMYYGTKCLIKTLPAQVKESDPRYDEKQWVKVAAPLFFITGIHMLLNQSDIIMLGAILGPEQAGVYAVSSRVASIVGFGIAAVNTISAPMFSELYSKGKTAQLQRIVTIGARGMSLVTLASATIIVIFSSFILGLFGEGFLEGQTVLFILLIGQCVNVLTGSVGTLMTMTGHQNQAAIIFGVAAIVNIALNAALIPLYGMEGAAIATAATTILWNLVMLTFVRRRLKINPTVLARI